ncbi:hypothetical protein TSH7_01355 [Azospirillum sp. TSH7]|uniref:hypothetical protein n=1 Tax=unclassified Azospirillum TaxID=2630922 RepID=UPI000D61E9F0|nr:MULTISPECIES: hypothetical protein [unclassified Azospirillum]PWC69119.1 hypothetical protein TSH7_01355 [Azospirillum sp. TSH7]PWC71389.1 hypothetical protein TSH20_03720 [Azospirillum sp. TSH20]
MTDAEFIALPLDAQRAILDEMREGQALADRWERIARKAIRLAGLSALVMLATNAMWLWLVVDLVGRVGSQQ